MNSKTAKRIRRALGMGKQANPMMEQTVRHIYRRIKRLWPSLSEAHRKAALEEIESHANG